MRTPDTPIVAGLCSVTFRSLDIATVARHAAGCHLQAIEWGSDVHVPVGDVAAAGNARAVCDDLGLDVASYGSYLAPGRVVDDAQVPAVLDTAVALGAPNVRVWAHGSNAAADLDVICGEAAARNLTISVEFHPGTRTETAAAANSLMDEVSRSNLYTYWQPDPALTPDEALAELDAVLPRVSHLQVFWWKADFSRLPLGDGEDLWPRALRLVAGTPSPLAPRIAFLEFVRDDDPAQLASDAAALLGWLRRITEPREGR